MHDLSVSVYVTWNALRGNRAPARDWPISSSGHQSAQRARASCAGFFYGMLNAPCPRVSTRIEAADSGGGGNVRVCVRACVRRSRLE